MSEEKGIERLEKRTYLQWHRDGLVDLALGGLVILFAAGMLTGQTLLAPIYGCIGYPVWLLMKRWITERRLGYVRFGEARREREKRGWIGLFGVGWVLLILMVVAYHFVVAEAGSGKLPGRTEILLGIIFVLLISGIGIVLQLPRLHIYSGTVLFFAFLAGYGQLSTEAGVLIPGIVISLSGLALLVSFLRKYPIPELDGDISDLEGGEPKQ